MHNDETFIIYEPERNMTYFSVILPGIYTGQNSVLENQRRIDDINTVLPDTLLTLVLIPLEIHISVSPCRKWQHRDTENSYDNTLIVYT